jgi:hypothetical protein
MTTTTDGSPRFVPIQPQATGHEQWDSRFGLPGFGSGGNKVTSIVIAPDGDIYAGGIFSEAGSIAAKNIARWDGRRWHPLGTGIDGPVYTLAVSGDNVYVGGDFTHAGAITANSLAVWNRASATWLALGNGTQGPKYSFGSRAVIRAIAVIGNDVYIGGNGIATVDGVAALGVARWNTVTQNWAALGGGVFSSSGNTVNAGFVFALSPAADGGLYVGGEFTKAGNATELTVNSIALWNPATNQWAALDSGLEWDNQIGKAYAIAISGSDVYVGGQFTSAGGVASASIARWNTANNWSALGGGVTWEGYLDSVKALAVVGRTLYAGGDFDTIAGITTGKIAGWDIVAGTWTALGSGISSATNEVLALLPSGDGGVYASGTFQQAGEVIALHMAKWNGSAWSALGQGVSSSEGQITTGGIVNAVAAHASGQVFIGGLFTEAGGKPAHNLAMWDGATWSALGSGANDVVDALSIRGDEIFVGGRFTQVGNISANHIASWNRTTGTWSALGSGINGRVYALAVGPDGTLYAGGEFTAAGSVDAYHVAAWNPATRTWAKLGTAITTIIGDVLTLVPDAEGVFIGGSIGDVKVGSSFVTVNGLFYWNRATDQAFRMGTGVTSQGSFGARRGIVQAMALSDDESTLYVGGEFDKAGTVAANGIARFDFDSGRWAALGNSVGGVTVPQVQAITGVGSDVYIGGLFTVAGAAQANNIARWDTQSQSWAALGSGVGLKYDFSTGVAALDIGRDGLYVGGNFITAGGHPASAFARWGAPLPPTLRINYAIGQPGSVLTLTGAGFPPNSMAAIAVNGRALVPDVPTTEQGSLTFMLNTAGADEGIYIVSANASRIASIKFVLSSDAPLRQQDGQGLVLNVPSGIALDPDATIYLSLVAH